MWVSEWVSLSHKRAERSTGRNLPPIKVESQEMWLPLLLVEIRNIYVCRTGSGINFYHRFYVKNSFNVKYFENMKRSDDWLNRGQIGNQQWTFNWYYKLWHQMTLSPLSLRSSKFDIYYFENGNRYDDGFNESQIGNDHGVSTGTMTFDLGWPWTVLDLAHRIFISNISKMARNMILDTKNVRRQTNHGKAFDCYYEPSWSLQFCSGVT